MDVILTNPPFGGEEEAGIKANFPQTCRRRKPRCCSCNTSCASCAWRARCRTAARVAAVVVPNGTLFGDGVCAVIKEEMLKEFNLHTIVRLPQGRVRARTPTFPANLLFFQRCGPTDKIWYYELPLPEGRKKYSKTAPLQFEAFQLGVDVVEHREEGPHAWEVDFAAKRAAVIETATPHRQRAESRARQAALALGKPIRGVGANHQQRRQRRQGHAASAVARAENPPAGPYEAAAKAAQAEGDALYWPIYNLGPEEPARRRGLEHADPKDRVAAMRAGEEDVLRLLSEIEGLVAEVQSDEAVAESGAWGWELRPADEPAAVHRERELSEFWHLQLWSGLFPNAPSGVCNQR